MTALLAETAAPRVKSPEAFRTISEVSVDLEVPQHVLRFWESRFAQVKPVKRAGGRRYYRPEDVDLLRGIRALLYAEGLTIKGVQKVLRDRGHRYVAEIGRGEVGHLAPADARTGRREERPGPASSPALVALARVQAAVEGANLDEARRVKLELLLAELLQMKGRLRAALSRPGS